MVVTAAAAVSLFNSPLSLLQAIMLSPVSLHERVTVLEASRWLEVVEEPVHLFVSSHEGGGIVVPRGAKHAVRVANPGKLRRIGHGRNVAEPSSRGGVEILLP